MILFFYVSFISAYAIFLFTTHFLFLFFFASGSALMEVVEVYKEIQAQQMNIVSSGTIFIPVLYCAFVE